MLKDSVKVIYSYYQDQATGHYKASQVFNGEKFFTDLEGRYQSMEELVAAVESFLAENRFNQAILLSTVQFNELLSSGAREMSQLRAGIEEKGVLITCAKVKSKGIFQGFF